MIRITKKQLTRIFIVVMLVILLVALVSIFFLNKAQNYVVLFGLVFIELNLLFMYYFIRRNLRD